MLQDAGLKVKEYELIRRNFSDSGNFGKTCSLGSEGMRCSGWGDRLQEQKGAAALYGDSANGRHCVSSGDNEGASASSQVLASSLAAADSSSSRSSSRAEAQQRNAGALSRRVLGPSHPIQQLKSDSVLASMAPVRGPADSSSRGCSVVCQAAASTNDAAAGAARQLPICEPALSAAEGGSSVGCGPSSSSSRSRAGTVQCGSGRIQTT
jgi:hypothetical protein